MEQPVPYLAALPQSDGVRMIHDDASYTETYAKVYDWTWSVPLSIQARCVYHYILYRIGANKDCKTWPRRKEIAAALGIGERALHVYLDELLNSGLIRVEHHIAEGRPSDYFAQKKEAVIARQTLLQNMQGAEPLAKYARPSRKICKRPLQIMQDNKEQIQDTDTEIDTKSTGGAYATAPPPSDPPKKERKPSLKSAEPEIYAKRERLKAHWLTLKGQQWAEIPDAKQKWMLTDLEHLARHFDESGVTTVMDLAWNEQWSNGTHPARRTTYRLTDLADKISAWRHGDWPEKPRAASKAEQPRPNPDRAMRQRADRVIAVRSYPVTAEQEAAIERSRRAREEAEHAQ